MNGGDRASQTCLFRGSEAGQWRMHSGGEHWPGLGPGVWRWTDRMEATGLKMELSLVLTPSMAGQRRTVLPMTSEGFEGEQTGWMWS